MPHETYDYYLQEPQHLFQMGTGPIPSSSPESQGTPCTSSLSVLII